MVQHHWRLRSNIFALGMSPLGRVYQRLRLSSLPASMQGKHRIANRFKISAASVAPLAPTRASPAPQGPQVPNGKPTSPYVERSNPMGPGGQGAAQTVSSKDPKAAAQAASDMRNIVRRKLTGYVGFANLPNQWHRKSVRKGFNFNVMVVGKRPISLETCLVDACSV